MEAHNIVLIIVVGLLVFYLCQQSRRDQKKGLEGFDVPEPPCNDPPPCWLYNSGPSPIRPPGQHLIPRESPQPPCAKCRSQLQMFW